jgi:hypothetical protein
VLNYETKKRSFVLCKVLTDGLELGRKPVTMGEIAGFLSSKMQEQGILHGCSLKAHLAGLRLKSNINQNIGKLQVHLFEDEDSARNWLESM